MKRPWWNSGWERPVYQWCDYGHPILKDGRCHQRHVLPEFGITSTPMFRWGDVNIRRFNIVERNQERMRQELANQDNAALFRLQNYAASLEANGPQ